MDFKYLEKMKYLYIGSSRIAESLVENCGISQLVNIRYFPDKEDETKKPKKVYVFRNSRILFAIFRTLAHNDKYKNNEVKSNDI